MGLWDRFFGSRESGARRTTRSTTPGVVDLSVFDLRGDDERRIETEGKSNLGGEDEQLAHKLVELVLRYDGLYSSDRPAADNVQEEIKSIGERLCSNGGDARMKRVAYRVAALGTGKRVRIRDLELHWDGICGWMY